MGDKSVRKFCGKVPTHTKEVVQTLVEYLHGRPYHEVKSATPRVDKLLLHSQYERQDDGDRGPSSYDATQSDMETMEDTAETGVMTS